MATTQANVLLIAPELSTVSQDLWDLILADVGNIVSSTIFGAYEEVAARYLVAHKLTLLQPGSIGSGASGPLKREKVGDVEYEYADSSNSMSRSDMDYTRTKYGMTFMSYRNMVIGNFRVVIPNV